MVFPFIILCGRAWVLKSHKYVFLSELYVYIVGSGILVYSSTLVSLISFNCTNYPNDPF